MSDDQQLNIQRGEQGAHCPKLIKPFAENRGHQWSRLPSLITTDSLTFLSANPRPPPPLHSLLLALLSPQANREEGVDEAKVEKDAKVGARRLTPRPRRRHQIVMSAGGLTGVLPGHWSVTEATQCTKCHPSHFQRKLPRKPPDERYPSLHSFMTTQPGVNQGPNVKCRAPLIFPSTLPHPLCCGLT